MMSLLSSRDLRRGILLFLFASWASKSVLDGDILLSTEVKDIGDAEEDASGVVDTSEVLRSRTRGVDTNAVNGKRQQRVSKMNETPPGIMDLLL